MTTLPRQLESLSYQELERIERQVQDLKRKCYNEASNRINADKARTMVQTIAKDLGVTLTAAATTPKPAQPTANGNGHGKKPTTKKAKTKAGVVRYRDPSNPKNVWTGRGPQPKWLATQTKAGRNLSDFAVA